MKITKDKSTFVPLSVLAIFAILGAGCASPASSAKVIPYTLDTCLVTGNELGSMGDVVTEVYEGRQLKFCCKPCVRKFHLNPQKYLSKLGS